MDYVVVDVFQRCLLVKSCGIRSSMISVEVVFLTCHFLLLLSVYTWISQQASIQPHACMHACY
jgi:hypothetical protein